MLKILVVGAGAIGCFVGGQLAAAGQCITLVGRPPLMNKVAVDGLTLRHPIQSPQVVFPKTVTSLEEISDVYDFALLTVKASSTKQAVDQLLDSKLIIKSTYLVSLQNGIGNEEILADAFGSQQVIAGTVTIPIKVPELGVIEISKDKGGLGLASLTGRQPVQLLADAFNQAGLTTPVYDDYRAMKWSKLLLNIINNASSAILNEPPAQIISNPDLFNLEIEALREGLAVMKAQSIKPVKLPGYPVDWLAWLVTTPWLPPILKRAILRPFLVSGRGSKMPSLQIDLAAGRSASEVNVLNGAIVTAGRQLNIPTPVNQAFTEILSGIVSNNLSWTEYQHQPARLLETVAAKRQAVL